MSRVDLIRLFSAETVPLEQVKVATLGSVLGTVKNMVGWAAPRLKSMGGYAAKHPIQAGAAAYGVGELAHMGGQIALGDNSPTNLIAPGLNAVSKTLSSAVPLARAGLAHQAGQVSNAVGALTSWALPKNSPTLAGINNFSDNMRDARDAGLTDVKENLWGAATNNGNYGAAVDHLIGQNTTAQRANVNRQLGANDRWAGTVGDISHSVGDAAANMLPFTPAGPVGLGGKLLAGAGVALGASNPTVDTLFDGPTGLRASDQPELPPTAPAATPAAAPPPTTPAAGSNAATAPPQAADQQSIQQTGDVTPQTNQGVLSKLQELVGNPQKAMELFQQLDPQSKMALVSGLALGGAGLVNHFAGGAGSTSAMLGALGLGVGGAGVYNAMNGGQPWEQVKSWANGLMSPADAAPDTTAAANATTAPNGATTQQAASQATVQPPAQTAEPLPQLSRNPDYEPLFSAAQNLMGMPEAQRPAAIGGLLKTLKPEQLKVLANTNPGIAIWSLMPNYLGGNKPQMQQFLQQNWPQLQTMAKQYTNGQPAV